MKGVFIKFVFLLTAGIVAVAPKPAKAQTEDNYQWRRLGATVWIDGSFDSYQEWRWAFKKNGEPINDTTYMLNVAGTTYVCGVYTDTFYFSDTTDTYITSYAYVEGTMSELTSLWEGVEVTNLSFRYWDSTAVTWVEVLRLRGPPIKPITERMINYYEQTPDSVKANANVDVFDNDGVDKSYMVDHTIYHLSVPLDVEEPVDKVRTVDLRVYPNPFNSSCEITVPENADVKIYDLRGNLIATPYSDGEPSSFVPLDKGDSEIAKQSSRGFVWQPDESIASGIYLVRATTQNGQTITKRIVYMK